MFTGMASIALDPAYRRVTVEEFLDMDFHGARAELEDGIIFMMTGGTRQHARVASRLLRELGILLEGSGCEPFGSDFGVRTAEQYVRYPDVSVFCGQADSPEHDGDRIADDPRVLIEVLSPSTKSHDEKTKLLEYKAMSSVQDIVLVDPFNNTVCVVHREQSEDWSEHWLKPEEDLGLRSLGVSISRAALGLRD